MGCDYPIAAYRSREFNPETKRYGLTFNPLKALNSTNSISVPCGKCTGCRLERSRQWAVRCMHEASLHDQNCFMTLTYSDEHLPVDYSVHQRDFQLFIKKLRKHCEPNKIRFFACGEYGDQSLRPHYHALIFGHDFNDKSLYETTKRGDRLYLSKSLQQLWPFGLAPLGSLTYQSAAYTARYAMKKISGPPAEQHYLRVHPLHGFICRVRPEFLLMSRRPGLGQGWFEKFGAEVFTHDAVIIEGKEAQPPRYYFQQLTEEQQRKITTKRTTAAKRNARPRTFNAETAHAETRDARISTLKRDKL
jgi:hypothetical protein